MWLSGKDAVLANLRKSVDDIRSSAGTGLTSAAEAIIAESKDIAPYDDGDLYDSAFVDPPKVAGKTTTVDLGYRGLPYIIDQHESLHYHHPNGKQAKFLEKPMMEQAPKTLNRIAAEIRKRTGL